jgi:hypothetical protein
MMLTYYVLKQYAYNVQIACSHKLLMQPSIHTVLHLSPFLYDLTVDKNIRNVLEYILDL